VDEPEQVLLAVALSTSEDDELSSAIDEHTLLPGTRHAHASPAGELQQSLVAKKTKGAKDGIGVDSHLGGEILGRWEAIAWLGLATGDGASYLGGDLVMQCHWLSAVDLDVRDDAMNTSIMDVLTQEELDAQALIAEARARQRRRWRRRALLVAAIVVVVGAGVGGYEAIGFSGSSMSGPFATAASRTWHSTGPTMWFHGGPPNYLGAGPSSLITCAGTSDGACYVVIQANGVAPNGKPTEPGGTPGFAPFRSTAYRTTNDGRTWRQLALPPATWLSSPIACASADSCAVGAVLNAGQPPNEPGSTVAVLTTRDGGRSWQEHLLPSSVGLVTDMSCPTISHCVALAWGQDAPVIDGLQPLSGADRFYATSVLTSNDGGISWTASANLPGRSGQHYLYLSSVACTEASCIFIGEGADIVPISAEGAYRTEDSRGIVLASTDGGRTLSESYQPPGWPDAVACAEASNCLVAFTNARSGKVTMLAGGAGLPWHALRAAGLPTLNTGSSWLACPATGHCMVVGTQVAVTTDGGEHWRLTGPLPPAPSGYSSNYPGQAACLPSGRCLLMQDVSPSSSSSGGVAARVLRNTP
jgi:hypothetical protein